MPDLPEVVSLENRRHLAVTRGILRFIGKVLIINTTFRLTVNGLENIPHTGPTMVLLNHVSNLDPIAVGLTCPFRDMTALCKYELYQSLLTRWIIVGWGAIPIKRFEFDRAALRRALDALKSPDILMLAPEGHRNRRMTDPKEGVAFLAHKSKAVIVPTGVSGTLAWGANLRRLRRAPITVDYGRPVRVRAGVTRDDYTLLTHEIMYQIAPLVAPELRGDYADLNKATMTTLEYIG